MQKVYLTLFFLALLSTSCSAVNEHNNTTLPVSSPATSITANLSAPSAVQSVMRVLCSSKTRGTGFLHKSGHIITANHVIEGCKTEHLSLLLSNKKEINITTTKTNPYLDLAILKPKKRINANPLLITSINKFTIGAPVAIWGYPYGYNGLRPLVVTGILSGEDQYPIKDHCPNNKKECYTKPRWVLNAAINSGNSGGPLIYQEDGKVFGVVITKLAPLPPEVQSALKALKNQASGFVYDKNVEGKIEKVSEAQVISLVLEHLRRQTQLVIGHATTNYDLINFLKANGIEP